MMQRMGALPAYEVPNKLLDLSPISSALMGYQQQQNTNANFAQQNRMMNMQEGRFGMEQQRFDREQQERAQMFPLELDQRRAGIAQTRATTSAAAAQAAQYQNLPPSERMKIAPSLGFKEGTPEHRNFVINGQAPNEQNTNAAQQITWGKDASGNWVAMQATRGGELVQSRLPGGVTPVPVPELAEAKAAATKLGEASAQAQVDLPGVEQRARSMFKALDDVETAINTNPRMVGPITGALPNVTGSAVDTQAKIDQVQGKVFLQAFDALRGAGAITETEGLQAKESLSRLQRTRVGTAAYYEAINDVRREIASLVQLARQKASARQPRTGGAPQTPAPAAAPADPLGIR